MLKDKNEQIGNIFLIASYLLRNKESDTALRKQIQLYSREYYEKAITQKELKKDEVATINYLIGELYRRVGQFDKAISFFNLAIDDKKKKIG